MCSKVQAEVQELSRVQAEVQESSYARDYIEVPLSEIVVDVAR